MAGGKLIRVPRRKRTKRTKRSIPRAILSGFPKKKLVKLRYCQEFSLNSGAGGYDQKIFRVNGLNDPDQQIGGHQPKGFDEWAKIYSHYTVMSSKIEARMVYKSVANAVPAYTGILLDTNTSGVSVFSGPEDALESRLVGKNWHLTGYYDSGELSTRMPASLRKSFNCKKFFGIKDPQDGNSYSALITSNPSQEAYFIVFQMPVGNGDPGEQAYMVTIDYVAEFRDPLVLLGS